MNAKSFEASILFFLEIKPEAEAGQRVCASAYEKIFKANNRGLVGLGYIAPDISLECKEFRKLAGAAGFSDLPKDDKDLYEKVMREVSNRKIDRAA